MRLTFFVLLLATAQSLAFNSYSQVTKLNLNMENTTVQEVLSNIEDQSEFYFLYNSKIVEVDREVSISLKNKKIDEVLDILFDETNIRYTIVDRQIVLSAGDANSKGNAPQEKEISGKVTDNSNMPLPGVTVMVKGTTQGTVTNADGVYSVNNVPQGATLVFSFVGMEAQEIVVENQTAINVTLQVSSIGIEEVVAIGYGTERRVNVIGSVSQVTSETLENRPVSSLSNAITGQMSGVTVIQRSGKPGFNDGEIRVRGVGSFGATPSALILVDGIPGSMDEINPNDIESISVLKDASSAAIYGARSANGVILITTKKGKEGKISVSYNGYYGVSKATEFPDFATSWEYAEMFNIANGTETYSAEDIAKYKSQSDPDNYPNTDFLNETFSRNGVQTGHDISITGGQKSNRYFLSVGYLNEQGLVIHNDYERYNFRLNLESDLGEKLKLTTRVAGSTEEANEPTTTANKNTSGVEGIIQTAVRYPAVYLGQASNGDFGIGPESGGTPVSWLASKGYYTRPTTKASVNGRLDWTPVNELILSAVGGYNFTLNESRHYRASQVLNADVTLPLATLDQYKNNVVFKTMQFFAEYSKEIKGHYLKALAGYSFEDQKSENFSGSRINFPSNDYTVMSMGGVDNQEVYGNDIEWAIQSLFGRFKYHYNHKYLFEATVRHDGSSRFPENQKYGTFPSLAVGWRVTEENFFKEAAPWVSNLKLKASWGILGNQNIGNYPYQSTLATGRNYPFGSSIANGAAYRTYKDPTIHWETTETKDFGFESGFFDNKLTLNVTYFDRFTYDILYKPSSSVSSILGVGISETNTGEVKNTGWEFELGHNNTLGQFNYQINGNFSIINNEVATLGLGNVEQPNGLIGNGSNLFIGYPMQMYYGYKSDGVFISDEDITEWADQSKVTPNPEPGDIRYKDISGPDGVPDGVVDATYDRTFIGSRIPKYTFSLNLAAQYKQFDFSAFLQGVAGVKGRLEYYVGYAFMNLGSIQQWQMDGRFDPENPVQYPDYPRLEIITNSGTPNTVLSDFWTIDASYLRIKNLQVGYTLPSRILEASRIDNLRVYFSAENLYSFNNYRQGWDPEINTNGSFYPILATFTLGVNVKF
ncbi:SusC/RagA family TonB-linked outer membrane protein [Maribellus comscasis]|uniref:SusC/RagA family TonB-linked outer membrane protein n=2 Tax=Maribellus comscasis TaxID=2681766 RepID=A0A6I6JZN3_9BACT|nr:SusC/RagA family TonB-linked outer membrane protein [Maribellus comscasis]